MHFYYDEIYWSEDQLENDRLKIEQFLKDTKNFLWRLVRHKRAFVEELHASMVEGWNAAEERFKEAINALKEASNSALRAHGLTGPELRLKLRNLQHVFGEMISGRGGSGILVRFLRVIDTLLDSVLQCLNLPGAIKEIKDAIRDARREDANEPTSGA